MTTLTLPRTSRFRPSFRDAAVPRIAASRPADSSRGATITRPTAEPLSVGRVLAVPLHAVFIGSTVLASVVFSLGMLSNIGAGRLQGDGDQLDSDTGRNAAGNSNRDTGMRGEEFPFFDGEI